MDKQERLNIKNKNIVSQFWLCAFCRSCSRQTCFRTDDQSDDVIHLKKDENRKKEENIQFDSKVQCLKLKVDEVPMSAESVPSLLPNEVFANNTNLKLLYNINIKGVFLLFMS